MVSDRLFYRVGEEGIELTFLKIKIFTLKFGSIEKASEVKLFHLVDGAFASIFLALTVGNRITNKFVVLKMKSGPFPYIALTPKEPDLFLRQISQQLHRGTLASRETRS